MNHPVLSSATVSRPVLHSFTQSHSVSGVKQHFSSQLIPQNSFKSAKETSLICWFVLPAARSCGNGWGGPSFPALQFYSKGPFLRNSLQCLNGKCLLYYTILYYTIIHMKHYVGIKSYKLLSDHSDYFTQKYTLVLILGWTEWVQPPNPITEKDPAVWLSLSSSSMLVQQKTFANFAQISVWHKCTATREGNTFI